MKEKVSDTITDWKLLRLFSRFISPYWTLIAISLCAVPLSTGATILIPLFLVDIVDNSIMTGNLDSLHFKVSLLAGVIFLGYVADGIYAFTLQKAGQKSIADIREALFSHTLHLPRAYFDKKPIGITLSRLTSDIEAIGESLATGVLSMVTDVIKTIVLVFIMFYLSWKLTILIILFFPVIFVVLSYIRKKLRLYFNLSRKSLAEATGYLHESLNGIKLVQLYVAEKKVLRQFKTKNRAFLKSQTRSNSYDAFLFSFIDSLTSVTMAVVIWYGTGQILAGLITIGVLIGFINTLSRIFVPIREFTQQLSVIQRALSAMEHVNELFMEPREEERRELPHQIKPELSSFNSLRFENVSFRYESSANTVLDNISFQINRGEKIALIGATGSGKSTILKLISRVYDHYEGSITLNGIEISSVPKRLLSRIITLMQQDIYLFNETLSFNISLDNPDITEEGVWRAIEYVQATDFVENLPEKLNHTIIDNGRNLSAGQAQLISFARSIASDSDLILLDEATSSVDSISENNIQKAIENIFNDKSVIAVAHRLSTIRKSDKILVIGNGRIVEEGTHRGLLKKNGHYVKLLHNLEEK